MPLGRPASMTDMQTPAGGEFRDGAQSPLMPRPPARGEQRSPVDATDDIRSRPAAPEGRPFAQWWALVLDGRHGWGSLDISPTRHGVTRYQLVVFPPGIDMVERRLLRAWRERSAAMFVELKSLVAALGLADSQRA